MRSSLNWQSCLFRIKIQQGPRRHEGAGPPRSQTPTATDEMWAVLTALTFKSKMEAIILVTQWNATQIEALLLVSTLPWTKVAAHSSCGRNCSLTHCSLHSVYYIVNYTGFDWLIFQTLHWNFLNIIASVDSLNIYATQAGAHSII